MEKPRGLFSLSLRVARKIRSQSKLGIYKAFSLSSLRGFYSRRSPSLEVVLAATQQFYLCYIRTCALRLALGALLKAASRKAVIGELQLTARNSQPRKSTGWLLLAELRPNCTSITLARKRSSAAGSLSCGQLTPAQVVNVAGIRTIEAAMISSANIMLLCLVSKLKQPQLQFWPLDRWKADHPDYYLPELPDSMSFFPIR